MQKVVGSNPISRSFLDLRQTATGGIVAAVAHSRGRAAEGVPLTQTHALARAVVREGVERWPAWWESEAVGPPQRSARPRSEFSRCSASTADMPVTRSGE